MPGKGLQVLRERPCFECAEIAAHRPQHQHLDLTVQPHAPRACSHRHAHRNLLRPRARTRKAQPRNVRTRNQQHERDARHQHEQGTRAIADHTVAERLDRHRVRVERDRIRFSYPAGYRAQLGTRAFRRRARREARDRVPAHVVAQRTPFRAVRGANVQIRVRRILTVAPQHTRDLHLATVQHQPF
jgi:hypothetical protein